jgi:hypothetical protein
MRAFRQNLERSNRQIIFPENGDEYATMSKAAAAEGKANEEGGGVETEKTVAQVAVKELTDEEMLIKAGIIAGEGAWGNCNEECPPCEFC